MKTLNAAIIGYGFMGRTHTYGYKTIPLYYKDLPYRINLTAICSGTYEKAVKAAEELGFDKAAREAEEIFEDPFFPVGRINETRDLSLFRGGDE